ncbi:hypothetical protein PBRA_009170 [Plasmodiophora brassicae]|uniref:Inositol polyphosphate-related phosphatase domain-containing protein n=1 Tax=Plasmodiophora brassicae TaxID=37360 RepID=A0A0G4J601_PLABS|nr:hypothetical protein PBRA_009170 [Plasmodiophora brassicae]
MEAPSSYQQGSAGDVDRDVVGGRRRRILAWTWNLGAAADDHGGPGACCQALPDGYDVYAFAVQECRSDALLDRIAKVMSSRRCRRLALLRDRTWGRGDGAFVRPKFTGIAVYARDDRVRCLRSGSFSTGHLEGSKGGAGALLDVDGVTVAIVGAHLASSSLDNRLRDAATLCRAMARSLCGATDCELTHAVDHCIVMGDLNFRVQMPVDDALAAVASNDLEALLERDELRHAMRAEQCFVDFAEPRIRFPPSYKLDPMRSLTGQRYAVESRPCWYKAGSGQPKVRVPSWCDRVLFTSRDLSSSVLIPVVSEGGRDLYAIHPADDLPVHTDHDCVYAGLELIISPRQAPLSTTTTSWSSVVIDRILCSPNPDDPSFVVSTRVGIQPDRQGCVSFRTGALGEPVPVNVLPRSASCLHLLIGVGLRSGQSASCHISVPVDDVHAQQQQQQQAQVVRRALRRWGRTVTDSNGQPIIAAVEYRILRDRSRSAEVAASVDTRSVIKGTAGQGRSPSRRRCATMDPGPAG